MGRSKQKDSGHRNAAGVTYAELIRSGRLEKGMNQEQLGAMVSVGKNAVGAWESGRSRPDISSVPTLCEALDLSLEEFFGMPKGKLQSSRPTVPKVFALRYLALTESHRKIILHEMDALLALQKESEPVRRKLIRIYSNDLSACAGPSFSIGEERGEQVWIEETPLTVKADELIRVSGDSMEPEFHDGDQVLVQHGSSIRPGDVAIFTSGDAGFIKVYQRDGLHSLNPTYPTMFFHEGDEVRCIGKVLGIAGKELFARDDEITEQMEKERMR